MKAVDIERHMREYYPDGHTGGIEFGSPRMHYEGRDTWAGTVTCCLDWRAEIRLSPLDAPGSLPDVVVGYVDFLILPLEEQPVADLLDL